MTMNMAAFAGEKIISDANHLAMVVGQGPDDGKTYGFLGWQNDAGRYCLRDVPVGQDWLIHLERPDWDTEGVIDMDAARRAQAEIRLWTPPEDGQDPAPFPQPAPGLLVVYVGISTEEAIRAAGVVRVEEDSFD